MCSLSRVVLLQSCEDLPDEKQAEHRHQDQCERSIANPVHLVPSHSATEPRDAWTSRFRTCLEPKMPSTPTTTDLPFRSPPAQGLAFVPDPGSAILRCCS